VLLVFGAPFATSLAGAPEHVQNMPLPGLTAADPTTVDPGVPRNEVWGLPWRTDVASTLSVEDEGATGISPEHLPHVFDRFYKADASRVGVSGGSGLGLSIVKAIVERHMGRMSVQSKPGEGTTFTIALPIAREEKAV